MTRRNRYWNKAGNRNKGEDEIAAFGERIHELEFSIGPLHQGISKHVSSGQNFLRMAKPCRDLDR
jgi:hypothetical protein